MVLNGLHATTASNYQNICCEGFKSGTGLRGSGVYFWDDEEGLAYELSCNWYDYSLNKLKAYKDCENKEMVIILGQWDIEENEFIDLEARELRVEIYQTGIALKIDMTNRSNLCGLFDAFIKRFEIEIGCQIKVMGVGVSPLSKDYSPNYPCQVLGPPYCYIVRDAGIIRHSLYRRT
ncbi:hypothetical protein SpiGrapes_1115 [Sphaerochaeta pleomorpha str. Grapes]|uniref:Uncharacterized protein n=1 Tax=Sphaerochaeta pleomorpha (strain ATCC BAA-1885 / DSM 22778 / Grapes) TaxID=158190 RepID=G8QS74_SPHPG|nr:hypothetical protein [Sphaerochaeta pleomorpha]AEV28935.1 hypothetical protein SpiGrapes_1115 [Sphaerochaeta pleomorpha str. Grapes]